jgi:hypothetical protein
MYDKNNLILINAEFFVNKFHKYFYSFKQLIKFYSATRLLYDLYQMNRLKIEENFYTPKTNIELLLAVDSWNNENDYAYNMFGHIYTWNTSYITDMSELFKDYIYFNDNITEWNTSNVKNMNQMFFNTMSFNQPIGQWDVRNVITMEGMFENAIVFDQSLKKWDVKNVVNMREMFYDVRLFSHSIKKWKFNKDVNKDYILYGAVSYSKYRFSKNCCIAFWCGCCN